MRCSPAELARVKARFPMWYIQRSLPFAAVPCDTAVKAATGRRICGASLRDLESQILTAADGAGEARRRAR
jgi:hypothetical protein